MFKYIVILNFIYRVMIKICKCLLIQVCRQAQIFVGKILVDLS